MTAYFNEIDGAAAHVLETLIVEGVIADGIVDRRSIRDVHPSDLDGFTQCHFFAGAGLWSVAARMAGFPDDRPLWTGSCPCQGESLAGKRLGADDPRHLWPDFFRLIRAQRPAIVVGEQVAAAAGTHWLDGVCADLENENYAARAVDIPACAVDAPHQRQRLYWIAVDDSIGAGLEGQHRDGDCRGEWPGSAGPASSTDGFLLADADRGGCAGWEEDAVWCALGGAALERADDGTLRNGSWWSDYEWIVSPLDGKARRAKPGIPFLVNGLPGRVDLWRIAGNAISPVLAAEVIRAYLETE